VRRRQKHTLKAATRQKLAQQLKDPAVRLKRLQAHLGSSGSGLTERAGWLRHQQSDAGDGPRQHAGAVPGKPPLRKAASERQHGPLLPALAVPAAGGVAAAAATPQQGNAHGGASTRLPRLARPAV
jgi:hypothetical protein